ncbi:c-type cytochrome [Rhodanobacter sp. C05]|uniref:c-type cytochrome n=1 Tax=Rhodanobacter sp. C05 TaxID=1945855 RepID=UPI0020C289A6|nr:c-type cytochrome [Rhodanobacter sp. C05]
MMHIGSRTLLPGLGLFVATALPLGAVHAVDAAAITTQGNGKGAAPCMACHGADGGGQASAGNPRLAGLDSAYLQKQLDDFSSGTRASPVMQATATALSEDERAALATYYSKLPIPPALMKQTTPMPAVDSAGAVLAISGRWDQQVPACVQCHGPAGVGVGAHFPPLAGQPTAYIEAQLKAWQQGTRHNDPLQLMQHLSSALSAQDISAVAGWFAAQPLDAKGATP